MAKAWTLPGWHGPLARPAGLPARLSGAGLTVGNGLRLPKKRLTRIFHSETGKTMANPCSAGFPACRIAGFQTCVPRLFNQAFERVCAPLFIGFRDSFQNGYAISALTRSVRRVAGRYWPVARATLFRWQWQPGRPPPGTLSAPDQCPGYDRQSSGSRWCADPSGFPAGSLHW